MKLKDGGIDVFYIDESSDGKIYVVTAITIPFLQRINGIWSITWPDHLEAAKAWRKRIAVSEKIPINKELHGNKIAAGVGHYHYGQRNFSRPASAALYRRILAGIDFIPDRSVISVAGERGMQLYGNTRLEMVMFALFQRMRRQCVARDTNAIVFFDQGHPEYRRLYRMSQVYLPTGSRFILWDHGEPTTNLPLDMFTKDGNEKNSKFCLFTQTADLIAYAAFMKVKNERGQLLPWQEQLNYEFLYDAVPSHVRNIHASGKTPRDGIVRLWLYDKKESAGR